MQLLPTTLLHFSSSSSSSSSGSPTSSHEQEFGGSFVHFDSQAPSSFPLHLYLRSSDATFHVPFSGGNQNRDIYKSLHRHKKDETPGCLEDVHRVSCCFLIFFSSISSLLLCLSFSLIFLVAHTSVVRSVGHAVEIFAQRLSRPH